jgi:cytochrome c-type biogenesis protein CcmH
VIPAALGLYFLVTSYDVDLDFLEGENPAELAALEELAIRFGGSADAPDGWILVGRSLMELGDYARARRALQEALRRTDSPDVELRLLYAVSLLQTDLRTGLTTAGDLIDQVLAEAPDNQQALWWGGLVALQRNQQALAVERWSSLLETNPPPDVAQVLREQLAALTGTAGAVVPAGDASGPVLAIEVAVAPEIATGALGPNAIVYLLARSPGGGPPLAAKQIPLSALPGRFELGVADAMIQGRTIAGQERVTVIARISLSGVATEQPGDIYGQAEVDVASGETVSITIDSIVPSA